MNTDTLTKQIIKWKWYLIIDTPVSYESEMELLEDHSAEEASAKWIFKSDRTHLILQIRNRVCQMLSLAFMIAEDKKFQGIF